MKKDTVLTFCRMTGVVVGSLVLLVGCCAPKSILEKHPHYMIQHLFSEMSSREVSELLRRKTGTIEMLSSLSRVRVNSGDDEYTFSEACMFKVPHSVRCEALGFLDRPQVVFTSDGEIVSSFSLHSNSLYTGKATPRNLSTLRGVPISVEEIITLLTGQPPSLSAVDYEWGFYIPPNHTYFLERHALQENIGQRIWVDVEKGRMSYFQKYDMTTGKIVYSVKLDSAYRSSSLPGFIEIEHEGEEGRVRIYHHTIEANPFSDNSFTFRHQPTSEETKIYQLDDPQVSVPPLAPYREAYRKE